MIEATHTRQAHSESSTPSIGNLLLRQSSTLGAASLLSQALMALTYARVANNCTPPVFGSAVALYSIWTAAFGLVDFGANSYSIREIAAKRLSISLHVRRAILRLAVTLTLGPALAVALDHRLGHTSSLHLLSVLAAIGAFGSQAALVPLRGQSRTTAVSVAMISDRIVAFTISLTTSSLLGALALPLSLLAGSLVSTSFALLAVRKEPYSRYDSIGSLNPWQGTAAFGCSALFSGASVLDVPIITALNPNLGGVYASISRWVTPLLLPSSVFSQAAYPHFSAVKSEREALVNLRTSLRLPLMTAFLPIIAALAAKPLVAALLGTDYAYAQLLFASLAIACIPALVSQPLVVFLQARGYEFPPSVLIAASVSIHLASAALLTALRVPLSPAISMGIAQTLLLTGLATTLLILRSRLKRERRS